MLDLSICMVSLNCWNVIRMCLDSLQTSDSTITYEVIVVDNTSTDDTPQLVKQHYPYVRIIQNTRNVVCPWITMIKQE